MTLLRLTFQTPTKPMVLEYALNPSFAVLRWRGLVARAQRRRNKSPELFLYGSAFLKASQVDREIKKSLTKLRRQALIPVPRVPTALSARERLNTLHEFYENCAYKLKGPKKRAELYRLNHLIHQAESLWQKGGHWEIEFPHPFLLSDLIKSDYEEFSPDYEYGGLYLSYAETGVGPLAAFHAKQDHAPKPQRFIGPNFILDFRPSHSFKEWNELKKFLKKYQLPLRAVGHIPLGKLITPNVTLEKLRRCRKLLSLEFVGAK